MQLLNYERAAEVLDVKKSTLYSWVSREKIPFVRISGRCVRFNLEVLQEWIKTRSREIEPQVA